MPALILQLTDKKNKYPFKSSDAFRLALIVLASKGANPRLYEAFEDLQKLMTGKQDEETAKKIKKCMRTLSLFLHPDKNGPLIEACKPLFDVNGFGSETTGFADANGLVNDVFKSIANLAVDKRKHEVQTKHGPMEVDNDAVILFQTEVSQFLHYLIATPDAKLFVPPVEKDTPAGIKGFDLTTKAGREAAAAAAKSSRKPETVADSLAKKMGTPMHRVGSEAAMDAQRKHHEGAIDKEAKKAEAERLKKASAFHGGIPMHPAGSEAAIKAAKAGHKKLDAKADKEAARREALDAKAKVKSTAAFTSAKDLAAEAIKEQQRRASKAPQHETPRRGGNNPDL